MTISAFFVHIAQVMTLVAVANADLGINPRYVLAQQQPRDVRPAMKLGSAVLGGVVVTDQTPSQPLRRANIGILGTDQAQVRLTMTDDNGRFVMPALPAGRYLVTASKAPYVDTVYGARLPGRPGTAIMLKDGEQRTDLVIKMMPGGAITGVITDEYGKPAVGVGVDLVRPQRRGGDQMLASAMSMLATLLLPRQITDDRGVYRFYGVPPGEYVVSAQPLDSGGGSVVQTEEDVQAAIRQLGEPASPSPGVLSSRTPTSTLVGPSDRPARPAAMTGPFFMRFPEPPNLQVPPGSPSGPTVGYAPVYYPGTTSASEALSVTIGPGDERRDVNIVARPVPTTRIEGHVFRPDGQPAPNVMIQLRGDDRLETMATMIASISGAGASRSDGSFLLSGVPPGRYTLYARRVSGPFRVPGAAEAAATEPDAALWASTEITADGRPITDLDLTLQPGMTISGRLVFDGIREPPKNFEGVNVAARPMRLLDFAQIANGLGRVGADGTFTISGLSPGLYRLSGAVSGPNAPMLWTEVSVVIDGRDVTDLPFEVRPGDNSANIVMTLTDRQQELTGTLQDASGRPATEYTMILFPADQKYRLPDSRRIQIARPATDGRFLFGGLLGPPPGDYLLAAVTDLRSEEQFDPAFLEALAKEAITLKLGPGEKKTQDVRLVGRLP
jgi:carboxypeptidase family protein